jgi:hypothetical protein
MLIGYRPALAVHGVHGDFGFWSPSSQGPSTERLWEGLGRESARRWATEIERVAANGRRTRA